MPTFRTLRTRAAERPPAGTMLLSPDAYASDFARRPLDAVSVGIRLLSEADVQAARAAAVKTALDYFDDDAHADDRFDAYNDALMREVVARAACDPNDARQPFFPGDEEEVREALTSDGVRAIWDEVDRLTIERSPLTPGATEDDVRDLPETWARCLGMLPAAKQRHLRRLLGFVVKALLDAEEAGSTVEDDNG